MFLALFIDANLVIFFKFITRMCFWDLEWVNIVMLFSDNDGAVPKIVDHIKSG